jgi:hypothetical protein
VTVTWGELHEPTGLEQLPAVPPVLLLLVPPLVVPPVAGAVPPVAGAVPPVAKAMPPVADAMPPAATVPPDDTVAPLPPEVSEELVPPLPCSPPTEAEAPAWLSSPAEPFAALHPHTPHANPIRTKFALGTATCSARARELALGIFYTIISRGPVASRVRSCA